MVVDGDTVFTALIMQQQSLPDVPAYPRPVMQAGTQGGKPRLAPVLVPGGTLIRVELRLNLTRR